MGCAELRSGRLTDEIAAEFLEKRRIAVTGVSGDPKGHGGNVIYTRLRDCGYDVVAINPNAETVEDDAAYPDLTSVPGTIDAVIVASNPEHSLDAVHECIDLGIGYVWLHHGLGAGSVEAEATRLGREHGLTVIDGGCPLMYPPVSDPAHRVMKVLSRLAGNLPKTV